MTGFLLLLLLCALQHSKNWDVPTCIKFCDTIEPYLTRKEDEISHEELDEIIREFDLTLTD